MCENLEKLIEMNKTTIFSLFITLLILGINITTLTTASSIEPMPGDLQNYEKTWSPDFSTDDGAYKIPDDIKSPNYIQDMLQEIDEDLILQYLEPLVAFGPRVTDSQACNDAEQYIYDEFKEMQGIQVRFEDWENQGRAGRNVEASLIGLQEEDILIICGHMDSVPESPGADDNGIGTVAAMIAADVMSEYDFNHTIRFVTFSGEEQGLLGSEIYAENCAQRQDPIAAVLNADMIGNADTQEGKSLIKLFSNDDSHWLVEFTETVSQTYDIGIGIVDRGYTYGSDHYSFWSQGYDAVFFHENDFSEVYHSPQDTIENMDISYAVNTTRLMVATLAELAEPTLVSAPPEAPQIQIITDPVYTQATQIEISSIDDDGDNVSFYIDWGDGQITDWTQTIPSAETMTLTHTWTRPGNYEVRAKAKDENQVVGPWGDELVFVDGPMLEISQINGGLLGGSLTITNVGGYGFDEGNLEIFADGTLLFTGASQIQPINGLQPGEQTISKFLLIGLGSVRLTLTASIEDVHETTFAQNGILYLLYLRI